MLKEIDYDEKMLILLIMTAAEKMYTKIVGNPNNNVGENYCHIVCVWIVAMMDSWY